MAEKMTDFCAPDWVPALPRNAPDSIPLCDFILDEAYGRYPISKAKPPFTCGLTGKEYSILQVKDRVESLARGLARELDWNPNKGTEWAKAVCVFTLNSIDSMTVVWAVHRLSGLATPANATYTAPELVHQLKTSKAKAIFTCLPLLHVALEAADVVGLSRSRIYLIELPEACAPGLSPPKEFKTVDDLISGGLRLPVLEPVRWNKGDGKTKVALLCFSSGTSGLPKGVMISHFNVISNIIQINTYEHAGRPEEHHDSVLGVMPQSHIYALVVICHARVYVGDNVVNLPRYSMEWMLNAIQRFNISTLFIVPPIIIQMANNPKLLGKYDLSAVKSVWTGAAPLAKEVAEKLLQQHPQWKVLQGYGLTETCTLVSSSSPRDPYLGSSGSLLPGISARLVTPSNELITTYDTPGELLIKSPSNALGYFQSPTATLETFQADGYVRTGDEAVFRKSATGYDHLFIIDRIKELIKVKGHQVAPAELEALLLGHPLVSDCVVIPVADDAAGEVPKAFVVKAIANGDAESVGDAELAKLLQMHVQEKTARYKWLKGGVEFIDVVPKSPSGKILRRVLRDREREKRRVAGAKL
ncbi:phenylacetyl-CoA ligase-like protein [Lepidopterella palustris CBS 459.81]|uniref:Phenylacetyl-CoA ligase-like protein n=1 Tax=Lepidopterella palustris CBS 459.81 TaxID=1314670 RepID=A0A8E2JDC1_9PEZI|nr:phenylacetyl-CoA ligase-like protein [Lepidopterella palustris CBS 459.81]